MVWNLLLDDVSPVLPLLGYQFLNWKHADFSRSKATNIYFFTGLTVGGFALDLSIQSQEVFASIANLIYWGAFTAGLSGFIVDPNRTLHASQAKIPASLPPPKMCLETSNPIINIQYSNHLS